MKRKFQIISDRFFNHTILGQMLAAFGNCFDFSSKRTMQDFKQPDRGTALNG